MHRVRKTVVAGAILLLAILLAINIGSFLADSNGTIRLALGVVFAFLILLRPKPDSDQSPSKDRRQPWLRFVVPALLATPAIILGIVTGIRQLHWLAGLLLAYVCFDWALPRRYSRDAALALFVLYWIHPPAGQFELAMQWLSVNGAEWLLHCLNFRVWADNYILRTGPMAFAVPQACSGMRTATTVMLTCLGTGLVMRLRWYDILTLLGLSIVQVLALNISRIAIMVRLSPDMPAGWADGFLHDSLAVFLIIAIVLSQFEATLMRIKRLKQKQRTRAEREGTAVPDNKASIYHPFWQTLFSWKWTILLLITAVALVSAAAYRRRPYHRSEMMRGIINDLSVTDLGKARELALKCLEFNPHSYETRSQLAHILLILREYDEALQQLSLMPETKRTPFETILRAWALVGKNQLNEAMALVNTIGSAAAVMPGIAMVKAEFAASRDDTKGVVDNIVYAANSILTLERVRALFPFLAAREQWKTIIRCHREMPYSQMHQSLIAVIAHLRDDRIHRAGTILREATARWPDEPVFLDCLLNLALVQPGSEWEDLFARNLRVNLRALNADHLATYLSSCFRIQRPELGWLTWLRLNKLDPNDPALLLVPAQHAKEWLRFRRHQLDLPGRTKEETINLKPLYHQTKTLWPFDTVWSAIPLVADFAAHTAEELRTDFLNRCLDELDRRENNGSINIRMRLMRPTALSLANRYEAAHDELDRLEKIYPELRISFLHTRMLLYDTEGDWEHSYETSRQYLAASESSLDATLVLINALIHMDYGMYALVVADQAMQTFPEVSRAAVARAAVLDAYRLNEEALFALENTPARADLLPTVASLLYATERYTELKRVAGVMGTSAPLWPEDKKQHVLLPPAELAVTRPPRPPLTARQHTIEARTHEKYASGSASPFARALNRRVAEWHRARGRKGASDIDTWTRTGRDRLEKAAALHQLALLLARDADHDGADRAAAAALELTPASRSLWRLRVALTEGNRGIIEEARKRFPDDPELWLASLIEQQSRLGEGDWGLDAIKRATRNDTFPPGTIVRAGDFLWRHRMPRASFAAAKYAMPRCRGLLPAFVLGLRSAITLGNLEDALTCAIHGAEHAREILPFYRTIATCKLLLNKIDRDLLTTMEQLHAAFPDETTWPEQLATVYFKRGDTRSVLSVIGPIMERNHLDLQVHTLLIGAEAARLENDRERAITMLERAHKKAPDNVAVINNLVYGLASGPDTVDRARKMIPELLDKATGSAAAFDTAATVCFAAGDYAQAEKYIMKALALTDRKDYGWAEIHLHAAEIYYRLKDYAAALRHINLVYSDPDRTPICDIRARELLSLLRKPAEREPGSVP